MGLTYAPINEQGVVLLFGMICEQLNIKVEAIRTGFPDAKVIDYREDPSRGTRKDVEFEFESSGFRRARHPVSKCDIIVCWKNDWKDCPTELEVIELRNAIRGLKGEEKIAEREISKPTPKAAQ